MMTTARRAAAGTTIAALLTAASAVTGFGSAVANAYTTTSDSGTVRLALTTEETALTNTASFRMAVCSDPALVQQLAANAIVVSSADCQAYVVWCSSSDPDTTDGTQVAFTRDGVSCVW